MPTSNSVDSGKTTIILERGKTGLGFNIKGGKDMQLFKGDNGIYVAKLKEDGAAAIDGRLKVGDKILEVNGVSLENVKHEVAVSTFVKAGGNVTMVVQPGAELIARKQHRLKEAMNDDSKSKTYAALVIAGVGIAAIAFLVYRHKHGGLF